MLNIPRINKSDIAEEEELKVRKVASKGNKGQAMIHRFGFTQGSPLSPLLSVYALEKTGAGMIDGLIMYADDGLIITEEENLDVKSMLSTFLMQRSGAIVATEKNLGRAIKFKFLGLDYDLEKRTVSYTIRYLDPQKLTEIKKQEIMESIIAKHGYSKAYFDTIRLLEKKKLVRLSKTGSTEAPSDLYALFTNMKTITISIDGEMEDLKPIIAQSNGDSNYGDLGNTTSKVVRETRT